MILKKEGMCLPSVYLIVSTALTQTTHDMAAWFPWIGWPERGKNDEEQARQKPQCLVDPSLGSDALITFAIFSIF